MKWMCIICKKIKDTEENEVICEECYEEWDIDDKTILGD
jgi:hypothetical protein